LEGVGGGAAELWLWIRNGCGLRQPKTWLAKVALEEAGDLGGVYAVGY